MFFGPRRTNGHAHVSRGCCPEMPVWFIFVAEVSHSCCFVWLTRQTSSSLTSQTTMKSRSGVCSPVHNPAPNRPPPRAKLPPPPGNGSTYITTSTVPCPHPEHLSFWCLQLGFLWIFVEAKKALKAQALLLLLAHVWAKSGLKQAKR